jgi:hypothetical protein
MNWLTRLTAALLRWSAGMLPPSRRLWLYALWAEAAEVPAGWLRLAWLIGGVRLTMREAALGRRFGYPLAFAVAAAGTARSAWSGPPGDSAIVINRVDVISIAVILAVLPWTIRRAYGPVAGSLLTRLVRTGGYATVLALVLVKTAVERVAGAPPNNFQGPVRAWVGEAAFLVVMACYATVILAYTALRSPAAPGTVAIGTSTGAAVGVMVYALGPLGFPLRFTGSWPPRLYDAAMALGVLLALCAPVAAALAAARRSSRSTPPASPTRQGAMAGLCTGATAALIVAVLSTATIALLPYDTVLRDWAAAHIGQWTPTVSQLAPIYGPQSYLGYIAGNSAFAAGYLIVLLLSPLAGCIFGAWTGWAGSNPRGLGLPLPPGSDRPPPRPVLGRQRGHNHRPASRDRGFSPGRQAPGGRACGV